MLGEPSDPRFLEGCEVRGAERRRLAILSERRGRLARFFALGSALLQYSTADASARYKVMSLLPGGADWETNDILPVQILKIYRFGRWKRAGFWLDPRSISARSASVLCGFAGGRGALRPFAAQQGADDDGCGGQQTRRSEPHRPIPIQNSGGTW